MQHAAPHGAALPVMELEPHDTYIRLRVAFCRELERHRSGVFRRAIVYDEDLEGVAS
jgi:hypothetical protein